MVLRLNGRREIQSKVKMSSATNDRRRLKYVVSWSFNPLWLNIDLVHQSRQNLLKSRSVDVELFGSIHLKTNTLKVSVEVKNPGSENTDDCKKTCPFTSELLRQSIFFHLSFCFLFSDSPFTAILMGPFNINGTFN